LKKRKNSYKALFAALECIAKSTARAEDVKTFLETPEDDPEDLAALDAVWEEEVVTFGPSNGAEEGCSQATNMLERMMREPVGKPTSVSAGQERT
jgi:nitrate reductase delta subunit